MGFPGGTSGKESTCQCRRHRFNPWVRKIPWKRKRQPTAVFLPGKSHGQRSLVGYSLWGCKESVTTEQLSTTKYKTDKQQGPIVQHRELYSFGKHWNDSNVTTIIFCKYFWKLFSLLPSWLYSRHSSESDAFIRTYLLQKKCKGNEWGNYSLPSVQNMICSKAICLKDGCVREARVSNSFSSDVVYQGQSLRGLWLRISATVHQMREDSPCNMTGRSGRSQLWERSSIKPHPLSSLKV